MNFYELINRRRVDEARRLIADPAEAHLTLASIAQRCGFHSVSAFNGAFKRYTGRTPSRFRTESAAAEAGPPRPTPPRPPAR
jgi:AraC-like DNA-binding protein